MLLLRACFLLSLLAAIYALAPDYHERQVGSFFRAPQPGSLSEDLSAVGLRRVTRALGANVRNFFSARNVFTFLQKVINFFGPVLQAITSVLPPSALRSGVGNMNFPGSKLAGQIASQYLTDLHEVLTQAGQSDFLTKEASEGNFLQMVLDLSINGLEKILRGVAQLQDASKDAFDSDSVTFNALQNPELSKPFFVSLLRDAHRIISQVVKGFLKLTSPPVRTAVGNIISQSKFEMREKLSDIVKGALETVNLITKDLVKSQFIKQEADWENVHEFLAIAVKSIVVHGLKALQELSKLILYILYRVKGVDKVPQPAPYPPLEVEKGLALDIISYALDLLNKISFEDMIHSIHQGLGASSKATAEITASESMKQLPDQIRYIGKHLTEIFAKLASVAIEELHTIAVATTGSKFITQPPSWENARDLILTVTKLALLTVKRVTEGAKNYFDSHLMNTLNIADWIVDLVKAIIPENLLKMVQKAAKMGLEGLISVTGDNTQNLIKQFVEGSELPLSDKLANSLKRIVAAINRDASRVAQDKFFTESPTIENAAKLIADAIKHSVSSGLQVTAEVAEDLSTGL